MRSSISFRYSSTESGFGILSSASCHQPPTYTSDATYDVGLKDENGRREFNPPSLMGVSQRERLFHDNRARSLRNVFKRHRHQLEKPLDEKALNDLVSFLCSL